MVNKIIHHNQQLICVADDVIIVSAGSTKKFTRFETESLIDRLYLKSNQFYDLIQRWQLLTKYFFSGTLAMILGIFYVSSGIYNIHNKN